MQVIYVAGPYRGKTPWAVERNIRRAEEIAFAISCRGAVALCPHTMNRYFDKTLTDEFWLAAALELAKRSDACFLVPGWADSSGSRGEREYFERAGKPIFNAIDALGAWLKQPLTSPPAVPLPPEVPGAPGVLIMPLGGEPVKP